MPSPSLDKALDDVIQEEYDRPWGKGGSSGTWGGGKWGKGGSWGGKSRSWGASDDGKWDGSSGNGASSRSRDSNGLDPKAKLDLSLDELIGSSPWDEKGKGRGKGRADYGWSTPGWGMWKGGGKGWKGPWMFKGDWDRWGSDRERWQPSRDNSRRRSRSRGERGRSRRRESSHLSWGPADRLGGDHRLAWAQCTRIKVRNIPRQLKARDIREAFEQEAGKTERCELDGSVATITFFHPEDARKAVDTFDRGELNGKTITVTLEPDA